MKSNKKIRICGARRKRFFIRIMVFLSMMTLFSLAFGVSLSDTEEPGPLLFVGMSILLVVLFFKKRGERRAERANQIIAEVTERDPEPVSEKLCSAFSRQRHKEMRLEALLYLLFAVLAAVWMIVLVLVDAQPLSYVVGVYGVLPFLLLVAAALLVASFLPIGMKASAWAINEYLRDEERQRILMERSLRPDQRGKGFVFCMRKVTEAPTIDAAAEELRAAARVYREPGVQLIALIFFVVIPNLMLVAAIAICVHTGSDYWMILMMAIVAVFCDMLYVYLWVKEREDDNPEDPTPWAEKVSAGKAALVRDRVLSVISSLDDAKALELCFDQAGTVKWRGSISETREFLGAQGCEAFLLTVEGRVLSVLLLEKPEKEDLATEKASPEDPSPQEDASLTEEDPSVTVKTYAGGAYKVTTYHNVSPFRATARDDVWASIVRIVKEGDLPTDGQLREAALNRIKLMDPAKKKEVEDDIREYLELCKKSVASVISGTKSLTNAEKKRKELLEASDWSRRRGSYEISDIDYIEKTLKEKKGLSRIEIRSMGKNPFLPIPKETYRPLLYVGMAGIAGDLITALIEKATGANLGIVYTILSCISGYCALNFATRWLNARGYARKFRKLQKASGNPEFWNKKVEAAAYKEFFDQIEKSR